MSAPTRPAFDPASVRLIAITDSLRDGPRGLALRAAAAVAGGATMVQLRLKEENARSLVEIARAMRAMLPDVPLIVNDRADVALAAGAAGADYVGIGPVYATGSKADAGSAIGAARFGELARRCGVPAVAIGGITRDTVSAVVAAGATGVAAISALFGASDPTLAAQAIRSALDATGR